MMGRLLELLQHICVDSIPIRKHVSCCQQPASSPAAASASVAAGLPLQGQISMLGGWMDRILSAEDWTRVSKQRAHGSRWVWWGGTGVGCEFAALCVDPLSGSSQRVPWPSRPAHTLDARLTLAPTKL